MKKVGKRDFSFTAQNNKQKTAQSKDSLKNDKIATCHTEGAKATEVSKNTESKLVVSSECEKSTKENKAESKTSTQNIA